MAYDDRPYFRDDSGQGDNAFMRGLRWLLTGSIELFTVFGIRVRLHAGMLVFIALVLLFGLGYGAGMSAGSRVIFVLTLFGSVLLHEFGHCFGARATGGTADDILLTPLGGLAFTNARQNPWPMFVTVACGPLVTLTLAVIFGLAFWASTGVGMIGPWQFAGGYRGMLGLSSISNWLYWGYTINWTLLVFNLIPGWPLDGGQLLQTMLWKRLGYYRSMLLAVQVGLVVHSLLFLTGLAGGPLFGGFFTAFIGVFGFMNCYRMRQLLISEGPWGFSSYDEPDYSSSLRRDKKPGMLERWQTNREQQKQQAKRAAIASEQAEVDRILAKVSSDGMHSLSNKEKQSLAAASERQRKFDADKEAKIKSWGY